MPKRQGGPTWTAPAASTWASGLAVDEFLDQEAGPVGRLADLVQGHDAGMMQAGDAAGLAQETLGVAACRRGCPASGSSGATMRSSSGSQARNDLAEGAHAQLLQQLEFSMPASGQACPASHTMLSSWAGTASPSMTWFAATPRRRCSRGSDTVSRVRSRSWQAGQRSTCSLIWSRSSRGIFPRDRLTSWPGSGQCLTGSWHSLQTVCRRSQRSAMALHGAQSCFDASCGVHYDHTRVGVQSRANRIAH